MGCWYVFDEKKSKTEIKKQLQKYGCCKIKRNTLKV